MSISGVDLIATVRRKANVERSRFVSDDEVLGFCNDSIADLWDLITNANEGYFSKSATFTLANGSNSISLAGATTGIPDVPPYPVAVPAPGDRSPITPLHTWGQDVAGNTSTQFFAVDGTASFPVSQGFIPPAGRVLQINVTPFVTFGSDTRFTIYKNGVPTAATMFVNAFESGSHNVTEGSFGEPVHFNGDTDVMDLVAQESGSPLQDYAMFATTIFQLDQPDGDFLKELALSYQIGSCTHEIPRLSLISDRARVGTPHFWIAGDTLSFYPTNHLPSGPITMDYEPRCPVLASTDVLPKELERFRDFIELGAVVAIKAKRSMTDEVAAFTAKQNSVRARITASVTHRKLGPRSIPMLDRDRMHVPPRYRGVRDWG